MLGFTVFMVSGCGLLDIFGPTPEPRLGAIQPRAAAGESHSLVVDDEGRLWSFGHGSNGQLALGSSTTPFAQAAPALAASDVRAVWAAGDNTLILNTGGRLLVAGYGPWLFGESIIVGQPSLREVPLPSDVRVRTAAVSSVGSVWAVDEAGELWVWGPNAAGQLGTGTTVDVTAPIATHSDVALVAAGPYHALIVTRDNWMLVAGTESPTEFRRLGRGDGTDNALSWAHVHTFAAPVRALAAGENHAGALLATGDLYLFGQNAFAQIYPESRSIVSVNRPALVATGIDTVSVAARYTLVRTGGGAWEIWGASEVPTSDLPADGVSFEVVAAGTFHAIGRPATFGGFDPERGAFWAAGNNTHGELGR